MARSGAHSAATLQVLSIIDNENNDINPKQIAPVMKELVLHGDVRLIQKLLEKLPNDQETCTCINQGATEAGAILVQQGREGELNQFNLDPHHNKQSMYFMQGVAGGVWSATRELVGNGADVRIQQIAVSVEGSGFLQQGFWRGLVCGLADASKAQNRDTIMRILATLLSQGLFKDVAAIPAIAVHIAALIPHIAYQEIMACLSSVLEGVLVCMAQENELEMLETTLDEVSCFPDLDQIIRRILPNLAIALSMTHLIEADVPSWQTLHNLKDAISRRAELEGQFHVGTNGFMAYISSIGQPAPEYVH